MIYSVYVCGDKDYCDGIMVTASSPVFAVREIARRLNGGRDGVYTFLGTVDSGVRGKIAIYRDYKNRIYNVHQADKQANHAHPLDEQMAMMVVDTDTGTVHYPGGFFIVSATKEEWMEAEKDGTKAIALAEERGRHIRVWES